MYAVDAPTIPAPTMTVCLVLGSTGLDRVLGILVKSREQFGWRWQQIEMCCASDPKLQMHFLPPTWAPSDPNILPVLLRLLSINSTRMSFLAPRASSSKLPMQTRFVRPPFSLPLLPQRRKLTRWLSSFRSSRSPQRSRPRPRSRRRGSQLPTLLGCQSLSR